METTFAAFLKTVLANSGLSNQDLATRLGITLAEIDRWLNRPDIQPEAWQFPALCRALKLKPEDKQTLRRLLGAYEELGEYLEDLMRKAGITNSDLARRVGVTGTTVNYWLMQNLAT